MSMFYSIPSSNCQRQPAIVVGIRHGHCGAFEIAEVAEACCASVIRVIRAQARLSSSNFNKII